MFAQKIKDLRKQRKLTQRAVAEALGMAEQTYQMYEYNQKKPGHDRLISFADYFDVPIDYLVGRSDNPNLNKKETITMSNIKLGIAPIAWTNDDMPDLGAENTFEQCISEMALAGYTGSEVGNKYPADRAVLKHALDLRGLTICNRWFSSFLLTKPFDEVTADFEQELDFLQYLGANVIGASEQSFSIQGTDKAVFAEKPVMDEAQWVTLCDGLNKLGEIANARGMKLTFHHHMGTVVQMAEEIDRLMQGTDPTKVHLLFDSGHLSFAGLCPVSVLQKHINRVAHVHLKDIRPAVVARVKDENMSFLQAVRAGAFTVPGDGSVDFSPLFEILNKAGYEGWFVVEAEQDPAIANPFEYALKARKYIKETANI